jgi:hypothetical protein
MLTSSTKRHRGMLMDVDRPRCVSAAVSVYSGATLVWDTCQHPGRICWARRICVAQCKALPERLVDLSRAESSSKVADLGAALHHPVGDKTRLGMHARSGLDEGGKGLLTERQRAETARSDRANSVVTMGMEGDHVRRTDAIAPDGLVLGEKTPSQIYYLPTLPEWFPNSKVIHGFRDARGAFACESGRRTFPPSSSLPKANPNRSFLHSLSTSPSCLRRVKGLQPTLRAREAVLRQVLFAEVRVTDCRSRETHQQAKWFSGGRFSRGYA